MLRSTLKDLAGSAEVAEAALIRAGVDPTARGEVIAIGGFARIAEELDVPVTRQAARGAGG
jgi:16S rRNA (adenine1518-N6/adenine1519-N6)-dimethyltransferase